MTEYWRMGASPVPSAETARFAREFEAAGWDGFAVGEAHGPDVQVTRTSGKEDQPLRIGRPLRLVVPARTGGHLPLVAIGHPMQPQSHLAQSVRVERDHSSVG